MKLDAFIQRPVLSTVISIFIVILGLLGLISLPITSYPDIAPPTVSVRTTYAGANAQTVLNAVVAPLEEQINGVENMDYISSTASNTGSANITITFKQGTDPDMAAINVQNRVSMAQGLMPAEVTQVGIITQKRQNSYLMAFSLYDKSDTYSTEFIENYAKINLIPQIQRIQGVGDANVMGADYALRIWLDPEKMAEHHLMPSDVSSALASQNLEAAPGSLGERENQTFEYVLKYKGRLQEISEFEEIVIKAKASGELLRLKDIAKIELGRVTYAFTCKVDGHSAVTCMVMQLAGSNATEVISNIQKELELVKATLPSGLDINETMNMNDFLFASIHEVVKTLIEAFVLVFLVVFVFLQDFRSTIIPSIAIPVALIGTFFALYSIGFSINLLTLNALVLAIAIVVDDAIVVVEGVHAKLDQGYTSPMKASIDAMRELGGAIISITLVMMAVFIPVSFMSGTSGTFYRQFGLTMAIAIGFSAVNALTLSPALCAVFLKVHDKESSLGDRMKTAGKEAANIMKEKYKPKRLFSISNKVTWLLIIATIVCMVLGLFEFENVITSSIACAIAFFALIGMFSKKFAIGFNNSFDKMTSRYRKGVERFVKKPILTILLVIVSIVGLGYMMIITPNSLVPNEDQGVIMGALSMPPGTSQDHTDHVISQVDSMLSASPAILSRTSISGFSMMGGQGSSYGTFIIKLKPWEERNIVGRSDMVAGMAFLKSRDVFKDAQIFFFQPPMIPGYGASSGVTLNLQDRTGGDLNKFFEVANNFLDEMRKRPEIQQAQTNFNPNFPQYMIDIDAAACLKAGIQPNLVLTTLQGYIGGMYVSNFNRFGKMYRVMLQAPREDRVNTESLKKIKIRNGDEMAPITQFMNIKKVYGPDNITRFNLYTSISVNGTPSTGYTSGDAIQAVREVAEQHLPQGYSYEFSSISREEASTTNTTAIVFLLCFVFIYLLLSAQYESYLLPWAVLLSVPFGLAGSFLFIQGVGGVNDLINLIIGQQLNLLGSASNNIYVQIALIMLMGLLAKNAILIIEFALDRRKMGMSIKWAAINGAAARLRPILMTSFAMIIGLLPMMFATGAGSNGNRSLGAASIGGMLIGVIFQIFIVPALFFIFQSIQEKFKPMTWESVDREDIKADLEQYAG